ncbi:MAG: glycosyl transferase family 1 [Micrococcales bacterium 73-15]|uniref:glycosyltransferase family 4 protein n=1 Tax=Salana multivorans TaxID=120377 RepID=UPI00096247DB|nr:glycosyltransferase family 1 protein [Salana multivorans]OJX98330.1 MAG: glycosyl transferase family 1 [Micrococcales bacterium 73-15]
MTRDPRVLLDATSIPANRAGVGRYVEETVRALVARGYPLAVVTQERDAERFVELAPGLRVVAAPRAIESTARRLVWEQTELPRLARRLRVDVVHSPHYTMPLRTPVPVVVTLHDATFFSDPGVHVPAKRHFFRAWTRTSLRRAAVCLVVSQASADELVTWAGADRRRLRVAPLGVDHARFRPPSSVEKLVAREHLGLSDRPYLAFLATLEPRKNVPALVRGFVLASERLTDPPALVLAGAPGWDDDVDPAIAAVPDHLTVLKPGYLPLEDLPGFLGGAELVCYPSLGEGFGLPVLEAMACGAPVLTTRLLSLPEVGGDAVAYTGTSAEEIAGSIEALLCDPDRLAELRGLATRRAATFDWARTADGCVAAYRSAASSR